MCDSRRTVNNRYYHELRMQFAKSGDIEHYKMLVRVHNKINAMTANVRGGE